MSLLGLNEHHQNNIVNYLRFARYQRSQRLRAVDACFRELRASRLNEDTYTIDEVNEMFDGLLLSVRGDVELELINSSHTNVLLLRNLFQQAENWHLKLQADISELENRELLEKIKDFEESEFRNISHEPVAKTTRLEPLNTSGDSTLLRIEIDRLVDENDKLKGRTKQLEATVIATQKEKNFMKSELENVQQLIRDYKPSASPEELDELKRQMSGLKTTIDKNEEVRRETLNHMEGDLTSTKHELLRVQEMLEMAEKELEKKVSSTAPFRNLKQMLHKKNDQMKELRQRLAKYENVQDE